LFTHRKQWIEANARRAANACSNLFRWPKKRVFFFFHFSFSKEVRKEVEGWVEVLIWISDTCDNPNRPQSNPLVKCKGAARLMTMRRLPVDNFSFFFFFFLNFFSIKSLASKKRYSFSRVNQEKQQQTTEGTMRALWSVRNAARLLVRRSRRQRQLGFFFFEIGKQEKKKEIELSKEKWFAPILTQNLNIQLSRCVVSFPKSKNYSVHGKRSPLIAFAKRLLNCCAWTNRRLSI